MAEADPWQTTVVWPYGAEREMEFEVCTAQWWHVLVEQPVRVVMLRCSNGMLRTFLCADPEMQVAQLTVQICSQVGSSRASFSMKKQLLGFAASRASVQRMAPCVGLLYGVLVVWFWEQSAKGMQAVVPLRPWYGHKTNVSFEDVLRTARKALSLRSVLEQVEEVAPLQRGKPSKTRREMVEKRAA